MSTLAPHAHRPSSQRTSRRYARISYADLGRATATATAPAHPLADTSLTAALRRRADEIESAFAAIEPELRALTPAQFEPEFPSLASARLRETLGLEIAPDRLTATWSQPLDVRGLYARCVLGTFCRLIERAFDRDLAARSDGESAQELIRRWGFTPSTSRRAPTAA